MKILLIQIGQGYFGKLALFPFIHRGRRSSEIFCGPGFYLDEDQGIFVPGDDVDLSQAAFKIPLKDPVFQSLELGQGQFFTLFAEGEALLGHRSES
jgi:hypothetical protein